MSAMMRSWPHRDCWRARKGSSVSRRRRPLWPGCCGRTLCGAGSGNRPGRGRRRRFERRGSIGVLHLEGVVSASASTDPLVGTQSVDPEWTAEALREADRDDSIDAVVLRVNSPGGSPAASWEIYQAVSEMEKPVVVSVGDVAASGAYYFSSAADLIVAAPSSQVGSIGVILAAVDLEELLEKVGMKYTVLTRGDYKDMGHVSREVTEEEKDILRQQMDLIYQQFISDGAKARDPLNEREVEELANGLTFPGEEALEKGLC